MQVKPRFQHTLYLVRLVSPQKPKISLFHEHLKTEIFSVKTNQEKEKRKKEKEKRKKEKRKRKQRRRGHPKPRRPPQYDTLEDQVNISSKQLWYVLLRSQIYSNACVR